MKGKHLGDYVLARSAETPRRAKGEVRQVVRDHVESGFDAWNVEVVGELGDRSSTFSLAEERITLADSAEVLVGMGMS